MTEQYLTAFCDAVAGIFESFGLQAPEQGPVRQVEFLDTRDNLVVVIGLSGSHKGNVAFSMPYDTAKAIASIMMMGMEVTEIDEFCAGALGEMANMICGQAGIRLGDSGFSLDITPPTVIHGEELRAVVSRAESVSVPFDSVSGGFALNLSLENRRCRI